MKIAQRDTAKDCYYKHVIPTLAQNQNERVMLIIEAGKNYSLSELVRRTGLEKSTMSRIVNHLRAAGRLECAPDRKCSISGITITPSRLPSIQRELFND